MQQLLAGLIFIGLLLAGTWIQYRLSRGRMWHPLWLAFSMTSAALLFLTSGAIGYRLDRQNALLAGNRWVDGVIWWEVHLGAVFALLAVLFWRAAIRETDRILSRSS